MSVLALLVNSGPVQVFGGGSAAAETFAQWLASTDGGSGPTRHWAMDETTGSTMTADVGGINGTYQNTADITLNITDAEAEKWVGFGGASGSPGHATIATPLQSAAFSAMLAVQFDLVQAKHVLLTTGGGSVPGQFSFEIVDDGVGGLKPRCWSVNDSGAPVIYVGSNTGTIPVGEWCVLFYVRRADGTQEVWCASATGVAQIALTLDSGTPPESWSAHPAATTWYLGAWTSLVAPLNGVARSLALWDSALDPSEIAALGSIDPQIQNVVWAVAIDAGSVETSASTSVPLQDHVHPEVDYTATVTVAGDLGTWDNGATFDVLNYDADGTDGTDTAGRYKITKGGIDSPTVALTIEVVDEAPEATDLPFFGQYYGGAPAAVFNGNNRMRASDTQGESFFFYAERTATVEQIDWHWRIDNSLSYSSGDGGEYDIEIRKANPTTKRPLTGASDLICQVQGVLPGNTGPTRFPTYTFTTQGQTVAGDPYCVVIRNTHGTPGSNFVSINHSLQTIWRNDATGGSGFTVPGTGGGSGSITVASGGISGDNVGSSAAIIAGWTPFILMGKDWNPWPIGTEDGDLRYRRMGGVIGALVYSDGIATNWGTTAAETAYKASINGNNQFRDRFRVTRATRIVSGVYIRAARLSSSGGNLLVRLESGPHNDDHTPGNGTLVEQVSVAASLFLNVGSSEDYNQVPSGSDTGTLDLVHYVWVPFTQNRTLTNGQTYAIRLVPDGCNLAAWCSGRSETSPRWRDMPNGRATATWSEWASTRTCSWNAWEDSRGCQISTNGGSSWSYGPSAARHAPITFRCVT